jgi:hypothetical protein
MNIEPLVMELFKNFDQNVETYVKEKKGIVSDIIQKLGITALTPVNGIG